MLWVLIRIALTHNTFLWRTEENYPLSVLLVLIRLQRVLLILKLWVPSQSGNISEAIIFHVQKLLGQTCQVTKMKIVTKTI